MSSKTYKISKAAKRYGLKEYPIHNSLFPEFFGDMEGVKAALRRVSPGFTPIENLRVATREEYHGICTNALVYHTPGWEMYVEYEVVEG